MKCVKKVWEGYDECKWPLVEIRRAPNGAAEKMVARNDGWKFCSKAEWKEAGRP